MSQRVRFNFRASDWEWTSTPAPFDHPAHSAEVALVDGKKATIVSEPYSTPGIDEQVVSIEFDHWWGFSWGEWFDAYEDELPELTRLVVPVSAVQNLSDEDARPDLGPGSHSYQRRMIEQVTLKLQQRLQVNTFLSPYELITLDEALPSDQRT